PWPRIVAIGGGTGLSSLLRGLKTYTSNLSAIVTVADDGGSSGRLRDEYRVLPPGDFRQCLIALADAEPLMKQLFDHRFKEGSLDGHAFGNLFIMAMADVTGNFEQALRESGKVLAVKGTIVPSTLQDVTLVASINGGSVVGESKIPKQNGPISHVSLKPAGGQAPVIFRPLDTTKHPEVRFIASDVVNVRIPSHHDPDKLARTIMRKVWQA